MQVKVAGSHLEVGESLTNYVKEHLIKEVSKYFSEAVNAEVHFTRENQLFKVLILVNEGVRGGIVVKSNSAANDVYGCFTEALAKISRQLQKYKERIKNYRRRKGGGLKAVNEETDLVIELEDESFIAPKYVLSPIADSNLETKPNEELNNNFTHHDNINIITEKTANVEELTVNEAIMRMDLADLPALIFINKSNHRLNIVYYRKDGNISWIDPQSINN
jgi:ribosomal subunit interface protein